MFSRFVGYDTGKKLSAKFYLMYFKTDFRMFVMQEIRVGLKNQDSNIIEGKKKLYFFVSTIRKRVNFYSTK